MPYIEIDANDNNKGSSKDIVYYLEKENKDIKEDEKEFFFNQDGNNFTADYVYKKIDSNTTKLSKNEAKYFSIYVSPSENELIHINNDKEKLRAYTKNLMDVYAINFNKNLKANDILYFAKIENNRTYNYNDRDVLNKFAVKGEKKTGFQTHIHILVSRKTATKFYKGDKTVDRYGNPLTSDHLLVKRSNTAKISPRADAKGGKHHKLDGKTVTIGFNRSQFKEKGEILFDKSFGYNRADDEKFSFLNRKKNNPKSLLNKGNKMTHISNDISLQDSPLKQKLYLEEQLEIVFSVPDQTKKYYTKKLKSKGITVTNNQFILKEKSIPFRDISDNAFSFFKNTYFPLLSLKNNLKPLSKEFDKNKEKNEKEL